MIATERVEHQLARVDRHDVVRLVGYLVAIALLGGVHTFAVFALPHELRLRLADNFATQHEPLELVHLDETVARLALNYFRRHCGEVCRRLAPIVRVSRVKPA